MSPSTANRKWTPGPWEAAERGGYGDFDGNSRVIIGDDMRVAVVQHHGHDWAEANTHLIAAAPDLYEALDVLTAHAEKAAALPLPISVLRRLEDAIESAKDLLAKVRGEQS